MPPFDLERGKISVRVSEGVYYQLLADIDDFKFKKANGEQNANAFFNQLIPNIIDYRVDKRRELRKYLEINIKHCIKECFQEKLLYDMDDLFDNTYFDDYREQYHRHVFHFRLNKSNIIRLQNFFDELQAHNQNKTSYLRNLFNEYANMRKDKREAICFDSEYKLLKRAIDSKLSISCAYQDNIYSLIPYKVDLNYIDGSLYLIALEVDDTRICHVFRLSWLRNIELKEIYEYQFIQEGINKLEYIIYNYDYTNKPTINLCRLRIKR
ncbi:MAG: hypothetical protein ACI4MB_06145 [Candidatus Coproplasma sp.]